MKTNNSEQALWLGLGSLSSFLLTIVSSVVLTRYFQIEEYGTYKQVLYVYQTLLIVFTLGIPKAYSYFLPRTPIDEAKSVIRKIRNIFFVLGGVFSLILLLSADFIAQILNNEDLGIAMRIFSPVPFLMLPTMGLESVLATYQKTQYAAFYNFVTRILMLIFIICPVVLFDGGFVSAIVGFVIASFISFLLATYLMFKPLLGANNYSTNLSYKEILEYSLPLFTASIWGLFLGSSDQFFISRYFGTEMFAIFSNGSIDLPFVSMVVAATSTVMTPYFSKIVYDNNNNLRVTILQTWNNVIEKTIKIIYPLLLFFLFFASDVIILLFGNEYINSAFFFQIKIFGNFFAVISYIGLIMAINANKVYSKVHLYHTFILILAQLFSVYFFSNAYLIVFISVLAKISITVTMIFYISKYFEFNFFTMFPVKLILQISLPSAVFLYLFKLSISLYFNLLPIEILLYGFIIYIAFYVSLVYVMKIEYFTIMEPILKRLKLKFSKN